MNMSILEALAKLNQADTEQWTADGLPLVAAVEELVGEQVTRADITKALPGFHRHVSYADLLAKLNTSKEQPKSTQQKVSEPELVSGEFEPVEVEVDAIRAEMLERREKLIPVVNQRYEEYLAAMESWRQVDEELGLLNNELSKYDEVASFEATINAYLNSGFNK